MHALTLACLAWLQLQAVVEPDARAAYVWVLGEYGERIQVGGWVVGAQMMGCIAFCASHRDLRGFELTILLLLALGQAVHRGTDSGIPPSSWPCHCSAAGCTLRAGRPV